MATSKKRTNISLDDEQDKQLELLAKRDKVPKATKAAQLIEVAMEIEEDDFWNKLAEERDTEDAEYIDHDQAWNHVL